MQLQFFTDQTVSRQIFIATVVGKKQLDCCFLKQHLIRKLKTLGLAWKNASFSPKNQQAVCFKK